MCICNDRRWIHQIRHRQKWDKGEDRNDRNVLRQQDREARLTTARLHEAFFIQGLKHDRRRRQRQYQTNAQRDGPRQTEHQCNTHHGGSSNRHLTAAKAQQLPTHRPKVLGFKFKTHKEQHHHDAELGKVLNGDNIHVQKRKDRGNHNARDQVSKDRPKPQSRSNGHGHNSSDEKDKGKQ